MAMPFSPGNGADAGRVTPFPRDRCTDEKLVRDAASGDRAALGLVWDRYARLVRSVLIGVMGPDSAVDDLVQDVFVAFHRGAARIEDASALRGYLVGIAARLGALELRRRKLRRWVGLSKTGELPDVPVAAADSEAREALTALYRVLDRLGNRRRLTFALRHVQKLELLEIGSALGMSESTVRRELRRAEQQVVALARGEPTLRRYLEQRGFAREAT